MRWWEAISDSSYYRRYHLKTINTFPEILSGYSLSINHPRLLRDPPARTHKLYRVGTESNFLGQFPKGSLEQIIPGARKYLFWCRVHLSQLGVTISHPGLCHLLRQLSQNYRPGRYQSIRAREARATPPDRERVRRERGAASWPLRLLVNIHHQIVITTMAWGFTFYVTVSASPYKCVNWGKNHKQCDHN